MLSDPTSTERPELTAQAVDAENAREFLRYRDNDPYTGRLQTHPLDCTRRCCIGRDEWQEDDL